MELVGKPLLAPQRHTTQGTEDANIPKRTATQSMHKLIVHVGIITLTHQVYYVNVRNTTAFSKALVPRRPSTMWGGKISCKSIGQACRERGFAWLFAHHWGGGAHVNGHQS